MSNDSHSTPPNSADDATVVAPAPAASTSASATAAAATVLSQTAAAATISPGTSSASIRTGSVVAPAAPPRTTLLALAFGSLTGLVLFMLTAMWLLRAH